VQVPLAPTLPPPSAFQAVVTSDGVVLTWTGELLSLVQSPVNYVYRVYRRTEGTLERTVIGEAQRGVDLHPTLVDRTVAWEKHYEYWIDIVTDVTSVSTPCALAEPQKSCTSRFEVEGENSPAVKVFTRDVFPPAIPVGLQAVFSGPGQKPFIDLVWAPDTDADLAGYNIYRRESSGPQQKMNPDLAKSPSYRDSDVVSGKTYFYSVSAVDARGNESAHSDEASETVP
jgi:fibronectin type 3 domain-containing protein